jgi:AcrR family transcriptional regulator
MAALPNRVPSAPFPVRRRARDAKRLAVLDTAAQLFLERTYGRTSLDDIAARLRITKPALYHYFGSKEAILLECYRRGSALIETSLEAIAAQPGPGLARVQAFIRSYAVIIMTVDLGRCIATLDDGELSPRARREVRGYKRAIDSRLRRLLEDGMRDGSVAPGDPKMAAFAIAGALNWIAAWYAPDGSCSADEIAESFARVFTRGLGAGPQP